MYELMTLRFYIRRGIFGIVQATTSIN